MFDGCIHFKEIERNREVSNSAIHQAEGRFKLQSGMGSNHKYRRVNSDVSEAMLFVLPDWSMEKGWHMKYNHRQLRLGFTSLNEMDAISLFNQICHSSSPLFLYNDQVHYKTLRNAVSARDHGVLHDNHKIRICI